VRTAKSALQQKALKIQTILDDIYPKVDIPLAHQDPYTLLVAVLLSAQCTDQRVNQISPLLFAQADNPQDMVDLGQEQIASIIRSCGLANNKSKAIWKLSQELLAKHRGKVPNNFADLEQLSGVGHKTASVVMAQAFGLPAFPVDTHIHRLAKRWGLSNGKDVSQTERDLKALYPTDNWHKLHLQFIYFGREYCPARGHQPDNCPICSWACKK
jgi:endonuclease-3